VTILPEYPDDDVLAVDPACWLYDPEPEPVSPELASIHADEQLVVMTNGYSLYVMKRSNLWHGRRHHRGSRARWIQRMMHLDE